jgi:hypothetical protein
MANLIALVDALVALAVIGAGASTLLSGLAAGGGALANLIALVDALVALAVVGAGAGGGAVGELVGNEGGVVSGVINLESSGVRASDWRPRHDEHYHEARFFAACSQDGC